MISIAKIDEVLESKGSVLDSTGDKIGAIEQVFISDDSQEPEWVTAKTGLFGQSETFIPLRGAVAEGHDIRVPFEKDLIKHAPRTDDRNGHLDSAQEDELHRYYAGGENDAPRGRLRRHSAGGAGYADQPHSEGFGHNEYDQLTGPQSEDLSHPRGTAEELPNTGREQDAQAAGREQDAQAAGREDPLNTESHGRHAR